MGLYNMSTLCHLSTFIIIPVWSLMAMHLKDIFEQGSVDCCDYTFEGLS